jgi:peptide/nickel transport system substrate-binding protein
MKRLASLCLCFAAITAASELRFCLRADPKTFNPLLVDEEAGEAVRYLSGGVLLRVDRLTQRYQPELARSWKISQAGRRIEFELRPGLKFSDGSALTAEDVEFTLRSLTDPKTHAPTGDSLRAQGRPPLVEVHAPYRLSVTFAAPIAGLERLFDQVAIVSARAFAATREPERMPVAGPYRIAEYKPGAHILLARNPHFWKADASGRRLPYIDNIRLYIQQNRDIELRHFERGEIHLINRLDAELVPALAAARNLGASFDTEQLWFNQAPQAPIAGHKKAWFRSREFRRAISSAINREDLCRAAFQGHGVPAAGPVSPADKLWFNAKLKPHVYEPGQALRRLEKLGLRLNRGVLRDPSGTPVEFSIITNSGNRARERMATLIQQDLAKLGIRVFVVTLDFPSLIERITRTFNYDACLLGLVNVDADPNAQMNIWLSSAANHQWDPLQPKPRTAWEAEVDRLMLAQATEPSQARRKKLFDRVQEIVWEEAPFLYLVNKSAFCAISSKLRNAAPSPLHPQTYWNIERLRLE